ncbi:hypothetical protein Scep_026877 [Stephania cephalantha]|uniref:Uncharacterized protein n=1 Tax=Stephania cephalantha TaxID=152367 RepID=A0AAP0ET81_9MAGN
MKASLKLRDPHNPNGGGGGGDHTTPVLRLKIPITILNLPFISTILTSDSSPLSFNLRTNSPSGPSLNLSYTPITTTTTTTTTPSPPPPPPLTLTLKSGVGLFGSPNNSPLILSAHFTLFSNNNNNNNPSTNPTFSLQLKPQFGQFSLKKTAISDSLPNPPKFPNFNGAHHFSGEGTPGRGSFRRGMPELDVGRDGFLSGVAVSAATVLPVGRRVAVRFRWGVNFPPEFGESRGSSLPVLTIEKVSVERRVVVEEEVERGGEDLKGMCGWMRREVEELRRENRELRESLDGYLRLRSGNVGGKTAPKPPSPSPSPSPSFGGNSGDFDRWRSKKSAMEESNGRREVKKSKDDVGEELKKAIKAASINGGA